MNLVQFIFFVPLIYLAFYLIAWIYARKHFPNGEADDRH